MTQYRKVNNGYYWFLEYKTTILWFIPIWLSVPRPFYDKIWGQRLDSLNTEGNISSWHENLEDFVKKWPNIDEYFKHYKAEQKRLEKLAAEWNKERDKDTGKIIKL